MTPKWHFLLGILFASAFWLVFPQTDWLYIALIFLASFLIDFDHYMNFVLEKNSFSLKKASEHFHKIKEKEEKEPFRESNRNSSFFLFHSLEFHAFVAVLGLFWEGFFFILIGMSFHSLTDILYMKYKVNLYRREFLLIRNALRNLKH